VNQKNLYFRCLELVKNQKPYVAKHPKTGLWYAICRKTKMVMSDGFKNRADAEQAWVEIEAIALADKIGQRSILDIDALTAKTSLD